MASAARTGTCCCLIWILTSCPLAVSQQDDHRPVWQRVLSGADAQRAANLKAQIEVLSAEGKFQEAQLQAEKLLQIRTKSQGQDHWQTVTAKYDLEALRRVSAQPAEAQKAYARLGELDGQATRFYLQGKYAQAQEHFEKALAIRARVLGPEHPNTATNYNNVATTLLVQSQYVEAQSFFEKGLAIHQKTLGQDHIDTIRNFNNLAANLQMQGKHLEAQPLLEKALASWQKLLGPEHSDVAFGYNNVASNLDAQGKLAQAQILYEKALAIRQRVQGIKPNEIIQSLNSLASNLGAQGKLAQAQPILEKAMAISEQMLGPEHLDTARTYNLLAVNLLSQGKYVQAQQLFKKALDIRMKSLRPTHPEIGTSYNNLGLSLRAKGKYTEAEQFFEKALAIHRKEFGENRLETAQSYNNLAFNLYSQREFARAQTPLETSLAIRQKLHGAEHPDIARSYNNLAANLNGSGKYAQAEKLHEKACAINEKLLGPEHPDTANCHNNLAFNLSAQGKLHEAVLHWQTALHGYECGRMNAASSGFERAVFKSDTISPRAALAVALAHLGQPLEAWMHAESDLSRGLLDDWNLAATATVEQQTRLARLRQLDALLVPLLARSDLPGNQRQRREELGQERSALLAGLIKEAAERSHKRVLSIEKIQQQIPADVALIFWLDVHTDGLDQHWACILRRQGKPIWQPLTGTGKDKAWTDDDLKLAEKTYEALINPSASAAERGKLLTNLRQQRLDPLEPHLQEVRHLLIVPTGAMAQVPVETLADRYRISYVPSATIFARLAKQHRPVQGDSLLALGDPVFTPSHIKLPDAPSHGLLLLAILPDTPAARAGLKSGDVLLTYDNTTLTKQDDLKLAPEGSPPVPVTYWREGQQNTARLDAGRLGVMIDKQPAPESVTDWQARQFSLVQRDKQLQELPGTRLEVECLAQLIPKHTLLFRSEASEQRLEELARSDELKRFRLLHLATHGEVNEGIPTESALILAQDQLPTRLDDQVAKNLSRKKSLDGRLTVGTILDDWNLDADLVVLSACSTGLGTKAGGEGLLGFAQALLQKGAKTVVLSRWKVDDSATALLMTRFYENMLGKRKDLKAPLPRAEALQEAKFWLRDLPRSEVEALVAQLTGGQLRGTVGAPLPIKGSKPTLPAGDKPYVAPYYWAAFVLIGDPY